MFEPSRGHSWKQGLNRRRKTLAGRAVPFTHLDVRKGQSGNFMGSGLQASHQDSVLSGGQLCLRGVLVLAFPRCAYLDAQKQRTALAYGKTQPLTKDVICLGGDDPPCPAQVGIDKQMTQCGCCLQNPFFCPHHLFDRCEQRCSGHVLTRFCVPLCFHFIS